MNVQIEAAELRRIFVAGDSAKSAKRLLGLVAKRLRAFNNL